MEAALVRAVLAPEPPPPETSVVAVQPAAVTEGNRVGEASPSNGTACPKVLRGWQLQPPWLRSDKLTREKRVLLTQVDEQEIERLVSRVATEVATPVKLSQVFRAYVTLLRRAEE